MTDARYPGVYEANHASVLEPAPQLALEDIQADLIPALEEAGAANEHIEIMDAEDDSPALRDLVASPGEQNTDVVMVYEGGNPPASGRDLSEVPEGVGVDEIERPDQSFWKQYRLVPNEYGEDLPDDVLDQMLARVQELFLPAERFFVGTIGGAVAGMLSAMTLEGVAYIDNVVTLAPFRRRGVATAMVVRAVSASLDAGAELVFLLAEEATVAQRLYERLGFVTRRRCYGFTRPLHGTASAS